MLEFDDVANDQRKVIYEQRDELLGTEDVSDNVAAMREDVIEGISNTYIPPGSIEDMWDVQGLTDAIEHELGQKLEIQNWLDADDSLDGDGLKERIKAALDEVRQEKEKIIPPEFMRRLEKQVMLDVLDRQWKDHLVSMDHLRQGIGLRSYANKNPKQEYKREAFDLFVNMLETVKQEVIGFLFMVQVRDENDVAAAEQRQPSQAKMEYNHPDTGSALQSEQPARQAEKTPFVRGNKKIGRNEPCPCGSGKKYKQCHGKL